MYEKLQYLNQLVLDINEGNYKEIKQAKKLFGKTNSVLLHNEKKIESKTEKANRNSYRQFIWEDIQDLTKSKARIIDKRYLSGGELELTFLKNGESFYKIYDCDSYEYKKNFEFESKAKKEIVQYEKQVEAKNNFWGF